VVRTVELDAKEAIMHPSGLLKDSGTRVQGAQERCGTSQGPPLSTYLYTAFHKHPTACNHVLPLAASCSADAPAINALGNLSSTQHRVQAFCTDWA
jgi:hypothetical protein